MAVLQQQHTRRGRGGSSRLVVAAAVATAVAALAGCICLLNASDTWLEAGQATVAQHSRSLRAAAAEVPGAHSGEAAAAAAAKLRARLSPPRVWTWRHIVGIVLSVAVSFTSSLDRECGSSLYMVLFACLLDMPFRKAAAMTAFTVALGALSPGIAAMSEAHITERGLLAVVDYPGALVLLPTMYWGISFGAIVNLWFPNWLLALLWVLFVGTSNLELAVSYFQYRGIKREAQAVAAQLTSAAASRATTSGGGSSSAAGVTAVVVELADLSAAAAAAAGGAGAGHANGAATPAAALQHRQQPTAPAEAPPAGEASALVVPLTRAEGARLMERANTLRGRSHRIEALALIYPVLYTPSVDRALRASHFVPAPPPLRATATPSVLDTMDSDRARLEAELPAFQTLFGRFTLKWRLWKRLNNHFELALVLKIVVLHLVTEAIRHHTSKPCTLRFWLQLFIMTGAVTGFLIFTVYAYAHRKLWRGAHWVDALAQVRNTRKQSLVEELQLLDAANAASNGGKDASCARPSSEEGGAPPPSASPAAAAGSTQQREEDAAAATTTCRRPRTAGSAAVAAGEAVAIGVRPEAAAADDDNMPSAPERSLESASSSFHGHGPNGAARRGCCACCSPKLRAKLPWFWGPPEAAITNITDCVSYNQYKRWSVPLILLCAAMTLPIGVLGCALGLPGGPAMSHQLLALGLKPRVVASTSRFLVLCFTFGSFVAHIISGNLEPTLAVAFGLLNLGLAPLGLLLFTKLRPRGTRVIAVSLLMGAAGFVIVFLGQLLPLMASMLGKHGVAVGKLAPGEPLARSTKASVLGLSNTFQIARFCKVH